jgi:hypothetical protein
MRRLIGVVFLMAATFALPAYAQETTGSIGGTVVDASRAVLPGATVTVVSPALMGTKTTVTNERGEYFVRLLPPGTYEVRTQMTGFASMVRAGIEVRVAQTAARSISSISTRTGSPRSSHGQRPTPSWGERCASISAQRAAGRG